MASDQLFKRLCTPEVLTIGWHLARRDSDDDFVTDPVRHADFASGLPQRLIHLCEEVSSHRYRPAHLLDIDVPKTGLSVRPGNVLPIKESLLLHAIVYLLAPKLDGQLADNVFSYRLHRDWAKRAKNHSLFREGHDSIPFLRNKTIRKLDPFESWYIAWPEFDAHANRAYREMGYTHLTKTDISAYFENIDLGILETQVRTLLRCNEAALVQVLFRILRGWTRVTSTGTPVGRGIPQGSEVSSFLGNVYLVPLDRALSQFCQRHQGYWCRYVDDVKVFTKDERTAREAIFFINHELRKLHLNLQGSKTQILSGRELEQDLCDTRLDVVNEVFKKVEKLDLDTHDGQRKATVHLRTVSKIASRFRCGLPTSVRKLDGAASRLLRRLMTLYGFCRRTHFIKTALVALQELPDLRMLHKTLVYLSQQPYSHHDEIAIELLHFVSDGLLPFPYQVGKVFETFRFLHPSDPKPFASKLREIGIARRMHWFVRQKCAEAICTFPYREDSATRLALTLLQDKHPWVRRAGCTLLVRSPIGNAQREVKRLCFHADDGVSRLCLYWRHLIEDAGFATSQLAGLAKGATTDASFMYSLPTLYVMRCTQVPAVAQELSKVVRRFDKTQSEKVRWHKEKILAATQWAIDDSSKSQRIPRSSIRNHISNTVKRSRICKHTSQMTSDLVPA